MLNEEKIQGERKQKKDPGLYAGILKQFVSVLKNGRENDAPI
jgi:hypothetical protein